MLYGELFAFRRGAFAMITETRNSADVVITVDGVFKRQGLKSNDSLFCKLYSFLKDLKSIFRQNIESNLH